MNLLRKYTGKQGVVQITKRGDGGLVYLDFALLKLGEGQTYDQSNGQNETALIILSGDCSVICNAQRFEVIAGRKDVFAGLPYSMYIPYNSSFEIIATTDVEIAITNAPSDVSAPVRLIAPEEVKTKSIGKDNWQRDAYIIIDENIKSKYFFIGEAIVPSGNWASYPPHRHDIDNLPDEVDMEEIYFFKISPPGGFAVQKVYTDDRSVDEIYTLTNNDTVMIPFGYHPVVVAPGYSLYYLWIMAGEKRKFISRLDSNHKWVANE